MSYSKDNSRVFMFGKPNHNSMIPSNKIARFASETLDIELEYEPSIGEKELDVLIIVNGAYSFAAKGVLEGLGDAILKAERLVWIQNDYTIYPPTHSGSATSPFRLAFRKRHDQGKAPVDFWSTVECMTKPGVTPLGKRIAGPGSRYIDWNTLTLIPDYPVREMRYRVMQNTVLYYGSYRTDRVKSFDRFFRSKGIDEYIVSSPSKRFEDEYGALPWMIFEPKFNDLMRSIAEYGGGLYMEDKRSHKLYMSPANRFYEMLSAGVPIFFEPKSTETLKKAGFDVKRWIAYDSEDVAELMKNKSDIMHSQRNLLLPIAVERASQLKSDVIEAWRSL